MIKLLAFSLALLFSSNVQAVETNQCFANRNALYGAVNEYVGDGRCAPQCVPDPLNCGCDDRQADYRGTLSTTSSGKTCQGWGGLEYDDEFPNKGLEGGHNYCRNIDDHPDGAWCFTTATYDREHCDVPSCDLAADVDGSECDIGKQYGWPINTWCVSNIKNMDSLFRRKSAFNGDLSSWDVSGVKNMEKMFYRASAFNGDLSSWDVSSVTTMEKMFFEARAFNQDLSSWDLSSVTSMWRMFEGASAFNQDLSSWDVSSVAGMDSMFADASAFNRALSSWNVSSVTTMKWMFKDASAFNQDLSSWDVSSVKSMTEMFADASAFNGDLSSWNVLSVITMNSMFSGAAAFNRDLCGWADTFNYETSLSIFAESGCVFPYDPVRAYEGPFCASTCTEAKLTWKRGDDPLCPDKQN